MPVTTTLIQLITANPSQLYYWQDILNILGGYFVRIWQIIIHSSKLLRIWQRLGQLTPKMQGWKKEKKKKKKEGETSSSNMKPGGRQNRTEISPWGQVE